MRPEQIGLSSKYIRQYMDVLKEKRLSMHNILIARGNEIVFEKYWEPFHPNFYHRMYSVSKSVVAIAVGFLEQDGKVDLDAPIGRYFSEEIKCSTDEHLHRQTVRHMLMMSTARLPQNDGNWFEVRPEDRVKYYFEDTETVSRPSGTIFDYDSTGSFILCALVERLSGKSLMEYLREKLFDKIGVSKEAYCLKSPGGHSWGDSGVICTQRDLFQIARFVMNKGVWNGEQLLNEEYLTAAVSKQVDNDVRGIGSWDIYGYGYQIWRTYQNSYLFYGMGCQIALCVPDKDLILVCNGDNQGNEYAMQIVLENFFRIIADHLEDRELPDDGNYDILMEETKNLKLTATFGEKVSALESSIHGVTYMMNQNPMGITHMRFEFGEQTITWFYSNVQGEKQIKFGRCENCIGTFPEEGYSDQIGSKRAPGHTYRCAASGSWTSWNKLFIKIQIIDTYFGNLNVSIGFKGDEIGVFMHKTAEDFLETYQGFAGGKAVS